MSEARRLAALRVARREEWEAIVRAGGDIGVVSTRTSRRWRAELGMPWLPAGGKREGAGKPARIVD